MQPIIGITAGIETSDTTIQKVCLIDKYILAILHSGGIPLIIPTGIPPSSISLVVDHVDGLLFTGGGDIETQRYGGIDNSKVYGVDVNRDDLEISLALASSQMKKAVLGICRGMQILNVALGGDLYSDIKDQYSESLKHDWFPGFPRDQIAHSLQVKPQSILHEIFQTESIEVNSLHHQGIKSVSPLLSPIAFSPDGIVEAVEYSECPFYLGVQWHPEWLFEREESKKLFSAFVEAAKK